MTKKSHILYRILTYSVTIIGSLWLFYVIIGGFNETLLKNKKNNQLATIAPELIAAANLKIAGNIEEAEFLLNSFVQENPQNYDGRLMLSEIYFETCMKDTLNCDLALWNLTYLIEKFPAKDLPYLYRSDVYYKLGDSIAAERDIADRLNN